MLVVATHHVGGRPEGLRVSADCSGGGGGVPLLAGNGTSGATGEKGIMSKISVDGGFVEMLPAWREPKTLRKVRTE